MPLKDIIYHRNWVWQNRIEVHKKITYLKTHSKDSVYTHQAWWKNVGVPVTRPILICGSNPKNLDLFNRKQSQHLTLKLLIHDISIFCVFVHLCLCLYVCLFLHYWNINIVSTWPHLWIALSIVIYIMTRMETHASAELQAQKRETKFNEEKCNLSPADDSLERKCIGFGVESK